MTNSTLTSFTWSGLPAWRLEDERLRIVTVPALGAKLVSLFDKTAGWEWLAPPPDFVTPRTPLPYAANFLQHSLYGWDEMFPTINAGMYPPGGPFAGRSLPDHGEVWTLPWQVLEPGTERFVTAVEGVALPYRLTRSLAIEAPGELMMRYQVENLSEQPMRYLWAAHPLFNGGPQVKIVLPGEVSHVVNVVAGDPHWGAVGQRYPWPTAVDQAGQNWRLDRLRDAHPHACRKFYLPPESPQPWGALHQTRLGCKLHLEWDASQLPYLGIWVDEGRHTPTTTVALEPTNGYYDGLETAVQQGRAGMLEPLGQAEWWLRVSLRIDVA